MASAEVSQPPGEVIQALAAEEYPRRIEAQQALEAWAAGTDQAGIKWLLQTGTDHADPEVRSRVFDVLRGKVMSELDGQRPGFIGITMVEAQVEFEGERMAAVAVTSVQEGSPAGEVGLEAGDQVLGIDGQRWTEGETPDQLARKVGGMRPGEEIELEVLRDGELKRFSLKLAPRPWAAGEWGELRQMRIAPFNGRFSPENMEQEEREKAFRRWLSQQDVKTAPE